MGTGRLWGTAVGLGIATILGAAGCFLREEPVASSSDEVSETTESDVNQLLRSALVLDAGCIATKVGPRHLLLAARCVVGNTALEAGKTIAFKPAAAPRTAADDNAAGDTTTNESTLNESRDRQDKLRDAAKPANKSTREATIAKVEVNASYTAKCTGELCAFGAVGASDAKDIALLVLDADLENIPTVPIDLDAVGQSDPLLAVGSGCSRFDGTPSTLKATRTIAVPAKSVNHDGSPYSKSPALVNRLGAGYVVTAGAAWRSTEAKICKGDIGAPLFRAGQAAVAGVTSNFTTYDAEKSLAVTVHHGRVDRASKVGPWLAALGVETTHSCSEAAEGCAERGYDGGAPERASNSPSPTTSDPETDAGKDARAADTDEDAGAREETPESSEVALPPVASTEPLPANTGEDYDAGPKKKKQAPSSCSATPAGTTGSSNAAGVLGLALAVAVLRRRRVSHR